MCIRDRPAPRFGAEQRLREDRPELLGDLLRRAVAVVVLQHERIAGHLRVHAPVSYTHLDVYKRQGFDYLVGDKMIGGFAVVAYPAKFGTSGIMTFMVNHDGVVFEKDLGEATAAEARKMKSYNPDADWKMVKTQ